MVCASLVYSGALYLWRVKMIRERRAVRYHERVGPTVLCFGLFVAEPGPGLFIRSRILALVVLLFGVVQGVVVGVGSWTVRYALFDVEGVAGRGWRVCPSSHVVLLHCVAGFA